MNILLIEDDLDLAETVIQYLELSQIVCDHASNGVSGLRLVQQNYYDCLLLDLNLPRLDGIDLCRRIRSDGIDTPVLMLTARDQLSDKMDGFSAGTDDFLVKPFELKELLMRIRALGRRRSGQVRRLRCADLEMDLDTHEVMRAGRVLKVTPSGWKLLEALLRHSPNVVSREQLSEAVWGEDQPDSDALKVHLHNLRKAVDSHSENKLIQTISGHGLAIRDNSS